MKTLHKIILSVFSIVFLLSACQSEPLVNENTTTNFPQISVQLWSVKDDLKKDFKGTLEALADMDFDGVEFAGEFGEFADSPKELKKYLNSIGLKVSGAHLSFDKLNIENFANTVAFYKALDCQVLIVPYDERAWNNEQVVNVVNDLNSLSEKLAPYGMFIGFHNHQHEFNAYQNTTYWDYIASSTNKKVILQQDVGWTHFANKSPVEYVRRYPGRTQTTHYKATLPEGVQNKLPIIGLDTIDWASLIKANVDVGGTEWIVLEQEEYPNGLTPLQAVVKSKNGLDKFIKAYSQKSN